MFPSNFCGFYKPFLLILLFSVHSLMRRLSPIEQYSVCHGIKVSQNVSSQSL
jgi:hypothetical protein